MRHSVVAAALAAAILAACGGGGGGDQGSENPGRDGFIVYSVSPTVQSPGHIFRIRPDGTEKLELPPGGRDGDPAFNSDGKTIVFSSSRDSPNPTGFGASTHLYKMSIDGTNPTRVTANPLSCTELHGHFSADDRMITFTMRCDDPIDYRIHRINADGSGQAPVVSDHPALAARHSEVFSAFGPNNRIVFAADLSGNAIGNPQPAKVDLFVMDADGRNTQRLTNLAPEGRNVFDGRLSVLGASVYFVTVNMNGFDGQLETINVDGTGRTLLYRIPNLAFADSVGASPRDTQFAPSPNGHFMAFVRHDQSSGNQVLMTALIDGTSATAIDASGLAAAPAWK